MTTAGDFDRFYCAAYDRLVLQIAALTGDVAEAEDHVQEGFIRAWSSWGRVGRYDDPEGWVRRAAYHRAVSAWRRARRLLPHGESRLDGAWMDPDQLSAIEALRRLPERERQALVLHGLVGLSVAEIAAELSAPAGTVKSWLSRGRARLARELEDERQEVSHDIG